MNAHVRATTFLNQRGDVTIAWTEDQDETMRAIIEKKMGEGVVFFIIQPRLGGIIAPKKKRIKTMRDLKKDDRAVAVDDEDFAKVLFAGTAQVVETPAGEVGTTKRAETAAEAAGAETVAVKPRRGG